MATRDDIIVSINDLLDGAVSAYSKNIPGIQRNILAEVEELVNSLDYDRDRIKNTVANIRVIGKIQARLKKIIFNAGYKEDVQQFIKAFSEVTTLQNQYIRTVISDFKVSPYLREIRTQSIQSTIQSLTEAGMIANIIDPIQTVLRNNITTGGSRRQLIQQARDLIINNKAGKGILDRYTKQVATDAIHQYNRNYIQAATQGQTSGWYLYSGSLITTSRCFCIAMREKKYFHEIEIPAILRGDFPEFKEHKCMIYDRTGLPEGMIAGTNTANFLVNLGGYYCAHRALPVPETTVPINIRNALYAKYPSLRPAA